MQEAQHAEILSTPILTIYSHLSPLQSPRCWGGDLGAIVRMGDWGISGARMRPKSRPRIGAPTTEKATVGAAFFFVYFFVAADKKIDS